MPLAVRGSLPDGARYRRAVLLVHGAASSAGVWTWWQQDLAAYGWASYALDLRGHGASTAADLSSASMADYADDLASLARSFSPLPVLAGWSMGGLVAMMVAASGLAAACVCLAPSTPALQVRADVPLREGEFGPEEYGITDLAAEEQPAMPDLDREERAIALAALGRESRLARDQRAAGVAVTSLPCPLLIATGTADTQWPRERYHGLHLPARFVPAEGASHWGLVLSRRTVAALVPEVLHWLDENGLAEDEEAST